MQDGVFMTMWTIYDHPLDFPDKFVARRWDIVRAGNKTEPVARAEHVTADTLDELRRDMMRRGLVCLTRSDGDEPQIVETWL